MRPAGRTAARLVRDGFHLVQRRHPLKRLDLELPHTLARDPEPTADLLERLRLGVVEAEAQHEHEPLPVGQRAEGLGDALRAEMILDLFVRIQAGLYGSRALTAPASSGMMLL